MILSFDAIDWYDRMTLLGLDYLFLDIAPTQHSQVDMHIADSVYVHLTRFLKTAQEFLQI